MNILENFRQELKKYNKIAEDYAENELSRLRSNAEKRLRDVEKRLDNLMDAGKEFEENITEDSNVMDKYSEKIFEEISKTYERVERTDKISLRNLNKYVGSLRDALTSQDKILIKYVKLLKDRKYKGRVKSLDRSLKRLNKDLKTLEDFIKNEYTPSAGVEEASSTIEMILELIEQYEHEYDELLKHEKEVLEKMEEMEEIAKELDSLENHPIRKEYQEAVETYENVQREIDYAFSHIRKVFRKYDKYVSKNRLSTDTNLLSELVTDAASAMAAQSSINGVKTLLKEIDDALDDTALNLARDKRENAKEDIERFLNGKLEDHYNKATEVVDQKEKLETKLDNLKLDSKIESVERDLAAAKRDTSRIYQRKLRSLEGTIDDMRKAIGDVTTQLMRITNDPVNLELKLPDLPEWIDSSQ